MHDAANQLSAKRLHKLNAVKRHLQSHNPLMLIVGEKGSGKTNLLTDVILQMRVSRHIIRVQGRQKLHPSQLVNVLSKHWTTKNINKEQRLESQLDEILDELSKHDQSCILVVDDAQLLSLSVLAALTHLATQQNGKKTHLYLLLSGRPILSEKMNSLQTKDIPQITLGALPRDAVFRKIKAKLDQAGINLPHASTNAVFTKIYQRSGGLPETVDQMVNTLILQRSPIETNNTKHTISAAATVIIDTKLWKNHRIKMTAIVGLIVTGVFMWTAWPQTYTQLSENTLQQMQITEQPTKAKPIVLASAPKPAPKKTPFILASISKSTPKKAPIILAKNFTLQLMSGDNKKAIETYIQSHHLQQQAQPMETEYKGHPWYVLAYGHFKTPFEAKKALAHLPKHLQQLHPWVRANAALHTVG